MTAAASEVQSQGGSARLVEGEFAFTADDFRRIAAMIHADAGIHLQESKATLVYSRLAKRLRALGLESFRDYCALIQDAEGVLQRYGAFNTPIASGQPKPATKQPTSKRGE